MSPAPNGTPSGGTRPAPGWYPDPWQPGHHRFWDGESWTTDTFPEVVSAPVAQGRWAFAPGQAGAAPAPVAPGGSWSATGPGGWNPPEAHPPVAPPPPPGWVPPASLPPPPPEPLPIEAQPEEPGRSRWPQALVALAVVVALLAGFAGEIEVRRRIHHSTAAVNLPPASTTPSTQAPSTATTVPANPLSPGTVPSTVPGTGSSPSGGPGGSGGSSGQATPSDPAHSVLDSMVLKQADVAPDASVGIVPDGQGLSAPTLDLCNASFPSEALRSDRLQVAGVDAQGVGSLQTEAVLYKDPASAAQALSELVKAKSGCPSSPLPDSSGQPITTRFNPAPDGGWPQTTGVDRQAYDFVRDDGSGTTDHVVEVFLRRGRALLGLYFAPDDPQLTVAGQSSIQGIVNLFAQRMAQLPAALIGA